MRHHRSMDDAMLPTPLGALQLAAVLCAIVAVFVLL
jgi:hypothetical protein